MEPSFKTRGLSQTSHFLGERTEVQRGLATPSSGSHGSEEETGTFLVGLFTLCYEHGEKAPEVMLPDYSLGFPPWSACSRA